MNIRYNLRLEGYAYRNGVAMTQEGRTYTIIKGRHTERLVDLPSAIKRFDMLAADGVPAKKPNQRELINQRRHARDIS